MEKPDISVIVPVYKVEEYLEKCVRSIMDQTFKKTEIILVDDGSPDGCPAMCDAFAGEDARIKVIHKENGGLSDARNAGLKIASAERIMFVDSDDHLDVSACEELLSRMEKHHADVVVGGYSEEYRQGIRNTSGAEREFVFTGKEAFSNILRGEVIPGFAWGKLFRKKLFEGREFPVGMTYEDAFLIPELLLESETVAVTTKSLYTYVHRSESITTRPFSDRAMDVIRAYSHILDVAKEKCPEHIPEAQFRVYWANFTALDRLLHMENAKEYPEYDQMTGYLKAHWKEIAGCPYFAKSRRAAGVALKCGMPFYRILWRIHERKTAVAR